MTQNKFSISEETNEMLNIITDVQNALGRFGAFCANYWGENSANYNKVCELCNDVDKHLFSEFAHVVQDAMDSGKKTI